jgi:DNA-directed RNA polymerase subunit RPC12/RpoP
MKRTESGLKVFGKDETKVLECSNCGLELMRLVPQKTSEEITYTVTVQCPKCGDKSFEEDMYGTFNFVIPDEVKLKNIQEDHKNKKVHFLTIPWSKK